MREIEILVKIHDSKKIALKKLSRFKLHHISLIEDQYFQHPNHKEFLPTKTRNSSGMIRTRKKDGKSYVTYKKDIFTKSGWAYSDEYETEIKDEKIFSEILSKIGFQPLVKVVNKRSIYYHKNFEICLEEVRGLGLFLEIECTNPGKKKPETVKDEILSLIRQTGLKVSEESMMGKGEMLYRKQHKINFTG